MLTQTEAPLIRELVGNMRSWQVKSIALTDYIAMALKKGHPLSLKEQCLLSEQARRSRVIQITYRRPGKNVETIFNLHETA